MKCDKCGQEAGAPPKELWVNVYADGVSGASKSKKEVDSYAVAGRIGNRAHRYVLAPEKPAKPRKKARKP